MKFSLVAFPETYSLPAKQPGGEDAHKQTQFLLSADLGLFQRAMNLQLAIVSENKKSRDAAVAAILPLWSRVFSYLSDACNAICRGSYVSCPPLLRAAVDCVAAERSLVADGFAEHEDWLSNAVSQAKEHQALAFDLGRYRAGSVLAEDGNLGSTYRLLTDLAMPHFGSTTLLVAPEAGLERMPVAFADHAFHLGWAELLLGWVLAVARSQLQTLCRQDVLIISPSLRVGVDGVVEQVGVSLARDARCRAEDMDGMFLLHNFRRTASGQPRRVML